MRKKSKYILSIVLLALATSGFSQFTFGPKVGVNFASFSDKTTMNAGIDAGIFFRIGGNFYFQPEVEYSFISSDFKGAWSEVQNLGKIKNHCLNIPLLLGFKFVNNPNFQFRLFIGPRIGVLIDNNYNENDNPLGTMQLGGRVGLGFDVWRFTIDGGYDFSASQPNNNLSSTKWWTQNMFFVSLGFKILKR